MKHQNRTIVVDFANESNYRRLISDGPTFLEFVIAYILSLGFQLLHKRHCTGKGTCLTRHSHYLRVKCGITIWRIQCKECGAVFTVMPSLLIRYFRHKAEQVESALVAYHGGLSFENCAICFNISGISLYRFICTLGKYSIAEILHKSGIPLPKNMWADEKHSECKGEKGYIPLLTSGHSIWHIDYVNNVEETVLAESYQNFAQEAQEIDSDYSPTSMSHDGFKSTINAIKNVFGSGVALLLCWIHACRSLERLLHPFSAQEGTKASWSLFDMLKKCHAQVSLNRISLRSHLTQMVRKYRRTLPPALFDSLKKWIDRKKPFLYASMDFPLKLSFGYPIDHLCNHLDRKLFMMKHFHHPNADKASFLRGFALIHEFIPYQRFARNAGKSPAQVDGAKLPHPNWFVSLLILTSGGYHKIQ